MFRLVLLLLFLVCDSATAQVPPETERCIQKAQVVQNISASDPNLFSNAVNTAYANCLLASLLDPKNEGIQSIVKALADEKQRLKASAVPETEMTQNRPAPSAENSTGAPPRVRRSSLPPPSVPSVPPSAGPFAGPNESTLPSLTSIAAAIDFDRILDLVHQSRPFAQYIKGSVQLVRQGFGGSKGKTHVVVGRMRVFDPNVNSEVEGQFLAQLEGGVVQCVRVGQGPFKQLPCYSVPESSQAAAETRAYFVAQRQRRLDYDRQAAELEQQAPRRANSERQRNSTDGNICEKGRYPDGSTMFGSMENGRCTGI